MSYLNAQQYKLLQSNSAAQAVKRRFTDFNMPSMKYKVRGDTHTHTHTHTHTPTHSHTRTHTNSPTRTHTPTHLLAHTPTHSHTRTHTNTHSHTHQLTHTPFLLSGEIYSPAGLSSQSPPAKGHITKPRMIKPSYPETSARLNFFWDTDSCVLLVFLSLSLAHTHTHTHTLAQICAGLRVLALQRDLGSIPARVGIKFFCVQ